MATELQNSPSISFPFDAFRRIRPDGSEYWSARELMPHLGYVKWQRMNQRIDRARLACRKLGYNPHDHFESTINDDKGPFPIGRPRTDTRLSLYGCYLVALHSDSRKPEIVAVQQHLLGILFP